MMNFKKYEDKEEQINDEIWEDAYKETKAWTDLSNGYLIDHLHLCDFEVLTSGYMKRGKYKKQVVKQCKKYLKSVGKKEINTWNVATIALIGSF